MTRKILTLLVIIFALHCNAQEKLAVPYRQGNLYGLCDTLGNVLAKPVYNSLKDFRYFSSGGKATARFVFTQNGKDKVVNSKGAVLVDGTAYDSIFIDYGDYIYTRLYKKGKVGWARENKVMAPPSYDNIIAVSGGYVVVVKDGKYGVANYTNKIVEPLVHDSIAETPAYDESNNIYFRTLDDWEKQLKLPVLDEMHAYIAGYKYMVDDEYVEEEVTVPGYDSIIAIEDTREFCIVKKGDLYGLYSTALRKLAVEPQYTRLFPVGFFRDHLALAAARNGKYGIVNETGEVMLPFEYTEIEANGYGHYFLKKGNLLGLFVPRTIYNPIPAIYDSIDYGATIQVNDNWSFLLFKVKRNGKEFYVGENGKEYYKP